MKNLFLILFVLFTFNAKASFFEEFTFGDMIITVSPIGKESEGPNGKQHYLITGIINKKVVLYQTGVQDGMIQNIHYNGFNCMYFAVHRKRPNKNQFEFVRLYYKIVEESGKYSIREIKHDAYKADTKEGKTRNKQTKKRK